jgi:hypothetical protein
MVALDRRVVAAIMPRMPGMDNLLLLVERLTPGVLA